MVPSKASANLVIRPPASIRSDNDDDAHLIFSRHPILFKVPQIGVILSYDQYLEAVHCRYPLTLSFGTVNRCFPFALSIGVAYGGVVP